MRQKIKINLAPAEHRFRPGQSGNPSGRRRTSSSESVTQSIMRKVREPITNPVTRRGRTSRYHLGARALVVQAAQGDRRALTAVMKLSKKASSRPVMHKISFDEAFYSGKYSLTLEFYEKQAREKAEFRRKVKEGRSFADEVHQELRKRVKMPIGDKVVRMSMQDVIAHNLANDVAKGDVSAIALLEKIAPSPFISQRRKFTEVAKPTEEQKYWAADKERR